MFNRHQAVGEREICSYMLQMASLLFAPPRSRSSCILSDYYHIFVFVQLNQIDEDLGVFLHQLLLHQLLLHQLLLHQDLFLVLYLVVLRDGGVAVELQLVVAVLGLAGLVVGVFVEVVVGHGYLAEIAVGVLVGVVVGQCQLAELLLIGGGPRNTYPVP